MNEPCRAFTTTAEFGVIQCPAILYKYLDSDGAKAFLKKPQIRFSDWRKLDDVMEVIPGCRIMTEPEILEVANRQSVQTGLSITDCSLMLRGISKFAASKPGGWERELRKLHEDQPGMIFICSMSERYDSGAMWAAYAEQHTGIVFGLSSALIAQRTNAWPSPVRYAQKRPQMPFPVIDLKVLNEALVTKSTDWDFQKEWRLIADNNSTVILQPSDVLEVIVGYRGHAEIVELAKLKKAAGVKIFQAYPDLELHRLARVEI